MSHIQSCPDTDNARTMPSWATWFTNPVAEMDANTLYTEIVYYFYLNDVASESVVTLCIKNDNPVIMAGSELFVKVPFITPDRRQS